MSVAISCFVSLHAWANVPQELLGEFQGRTLRLFDSHACGLTISSGDSANVVKIHFFAHLGGSGPFDRNESIGGDFVGSFSPGNLNFKSVTQGSVPTGLPFSRTESLAIQVDGNGKPTRAKYRSADQVGEDSPDVISRTCIIGR